MTVSEYIHIWPPKAMAEIRAPDSRNGLRPRDSQTGPTIGNAIPASPQNEPEAKDSRPIPTKIMKGRSFGFTEVRQRSTTRSFRPSISFTSMSIYVSIMRTITENISVRPFTTVSTKPFTFISL